MRWTLGRSAAAAALFMVVACSKDSDPSANKTQTGGGTGGSAGGEAGRQGSTGGAGGSGASGGGASGGGASGGSAGRDGTGGGADAGDAGEPATGGTAGPGGGASGSGNAGTGNAGAGGAPDDGPLIVVVLGASTAAGKNIDVPMYGGMAGGMADTWPSKYAVYLSTQRPGSRLVNLAKAGYSTYHALPTGTTNPSGYPAVDTARNVTAALAENPDVIIVQFPGPAELGLGDNIQDIVDNYKTIMNTAAAAGVETWIASTQPTPSAMPADITIGLSLRDATMTEFGTHALDFWDALAQNDDTADPALFLSDDTHPNVAGHLALYNVVVAADIPGSL